MYRQQRIIQYVCVFSSENRVKFTQLSMWLFVKKSYMNVLVGNVNNVTAGDYFITWFYVSLSLSLHVLLLSARNSAVFTRYTSSTIETLQYLYVYNLKQILYYFVCFCCVVAAAVYRMYAIPMHVGTGTYLYMRVEILTWLPECIFLPLKCMFNIF